MRYRVEISGRESKTEPGFYESEAVLMYGSEVLLKTNDMARCSVRAARFALQDLAEAMKDLELPDTPGCEETIPSDGECS
jgi:hypothetical protein